MISARLHGVTSWQLEMHFYKINYAFAYSLDKLCLHFYTSILKFKYPNASAECMVLWINLASTKYTYSVSIKLFSIFSSRNDDHTHLAGADNVDVRWKPIKAYASGVLWERTTVDAKIPLDGSSRSTYVRAGEICFAPSYRTQSAHVWYAWRTSQFDLQLTRRINIKFWELSVILPISMM